MNRVADFLEPLNTVPRPVMNADAAQEYSVDPGHERRYHQRDWQSAGRAIEFVRSRAQGDKPFFLCLILVQRLALGTMTIAAGVVRDPQRTTVVTLVHVAAQLRGATPLDRPHGTPLLQRHGVALPIPRTMGPEDIGHLDVAPHDRDAIYEVGRSRAGHSSMGLGMRDR